MFPQGKGRSARYGAAHQAERRRRLHTVRAGDPCGYCARPLPPDTSTWALPHNVAGTGYLPGFWHQRCNLREAAIRGARIVNAKLGRPVKAPSGPVDAFTRRQW